jgi:AbrB family looped-hinge helix DNA binding protein
MRITSKGQVTIPIEIREKMGLLPETEIKFKIAGNTVFLERVESPLKRGRHLINRMRRKATVKMTTDEILALTRG